MRVVELGLELVVEDGVEQKIELILCLQVDPVQEVEVELEPIVGIILEEGL